jgi:hypothetical protein
MGHKPSRGSKMAIPCRILNFERKFKRLKTCREINANTTQRRVEKEGIVNQSRADVETLFVATKYKRESYHPVTDYIHHHHHHHHVVSEVVEEESE